MRGCRNLNTLSFECCDWSACVASESWGELPVPPAEVIARGTQGVFLFVKAALLGGFTLRFHVFSFECLFMDISRWFHNEDVLLPLLEAFRDVKLSRLNSMRLVIIFALNKKKMQLVVTHVLQDGNQIGDRGAEMMGEGLKVNSSLRDLHLVRHFYHHLFWIVSAMRVYVFCSVFF